MRSVHLPGQNYQIPRAEVPFSFYLAWCLLDCSNSVCMLPCVAGLLLPLPPALNRALDHSQLIRKRRKHTLAAVFPLPSASLLEISDYSRVKDRRANVICSSNVIGLSWGILPSAACASVAEYPSPISASNTSACKLLDGDVAAPPSAASDGSFPFNSSTNRAARRLPTPGARARRC